MYRTHRVILACLPLLFLALMTPSAGADVIALRDGSALEGTILHVTEAGLEVEVFEGVTILVPYRYLDPEVAFELRLAAMTDITVDTRMRLAAWCEEYPELHDHAVAIYEEVLRDERQHGGAEAGLRRMGRVWDPGARVSVPESEAPTPPPPVVERPRETPEPPPSTPSEPPRIPEPTEPGPTTPRIRTVSLDLSLAIQWRDDTPARPDPTPALLDVLTEMLAEEGVRVVPADGELQVEGALELTQTLLSTFFEEVVAVRFEGRSRITVTDNRGGHPPETRSASAAATRNDLSLSINAVVHDLAARIVAQILGASR